MPKKIITHPLLVLDIDETLVFTELWAMDDCDFHLTFGSSALAQDAYGVKKRPFVDEFLRWCFASRDIFHTAVWTAGTADYAAAILEKLLLPGEIPEFVFSRERCTRALRNPNNEDMHGFIDLKDLRKVHKRGHDLARVLMVDNTPSVLRRNYGNLVAIPSFEGRSDDTYLKRLPPFLLEWFAEPDVRPIEKRGWWNSSAAHVSPAEFVGCGCQARTTQAAPESDYPRYYRMTTNHRTLVAISAIALMCGCPAPGPGDLEETNAYTPSSSSGSDPTEGGEVIFGTRCDNAAIHDKIVRVLDGDTVEISSGPKIRMLLVDTPEIAHNSSEIAECYGNEARDFASSRLLGKWVDFEYDTVCTDKYARSLAYIVLNNGTEVFNETLLREGYATVLHIPPNGSERVDAYRELEWEAKKSGLGGHGSCDSFNE